MTTRLRNDMEITGMTGEQGLQNGTKLPKEDEHRQGGQNTTQSSKLASFPHQIIPCLETHLMNATKK